MADRPTLLPPIQSSFLIAAPFSVWHSLVRTRWHFYGHFIAPFIHSGESGKPVCALPSVWRCFAPVSGLVVVPSLLRNIASVREFKWRRKKIYSVRNYRSLLSRMQNGVSLLLSLLSSPHFSFVFLRASSRVLPRSFSTPPDCPSDHTGRELPSPQCVMDIMSAVRLGGGPSLHCIAPLIFVGR